MRRYWLEPTSLTNNHFEITGDIFQHIFVVCRQDVGSQFEILVGDHKAYLVRVTAKDKKSATAEIISVREVEVLPKPHLNLILSLCKYPVMDSVIERAVELGVQSIQIVYSDFSFLQTDLPKAKLERWEKIIVSATQQSGRGSRMALRAPLPLVKILTQTINQDPAVLCLFAYEGAGEPLRERLQFEKARLNEIQGGAENASVQEIKIFLGSEGGYSAAEVNRFKDLDIQPVTLGSKVLRVETACLALVSVLKYEFGIMR